MRREDVKALANNLVDLNDHIIEDETLSALQGSYISGNSTLLDEILVQLDRARVLARVTVADT